MLQKVAAYWPRVVVGAFLAIGIAAAVRGYVPVPGQSPNANPTGVALSRLGQVILTENNMQSYWVGGVTQWTVAAKGVTVNKIYAAQAQAEADELEATVPASAPMTVPLALLTSESVLDPKCQNGNFAGSNPTKDPLGYDDGVAQIKLRYLVGTHGVTDAASAQAFAFDVTRAIPYFWSLYNAHLATADSWISAGGPSTIDPRLMNRWVLASLIYKQGATGARAIFQTGTWPPELNNFVSLEGYFAQQLGTKSVFATL